MAQAEAHVPQPHAPQFVADEFRKKYCEVLAKHPKYMNRFYHAESQVYLRIATSSYSQPVSYNATGLDDIQALFNQHLSSAKLVSDCCVAQGTLENSVLLLTSGRINSSSFGDMAYTQSIMLAPQQPSGYFVLNDMLCLHPIPGSAATAAPGAKAAAPVNGVAATPAPAAPAASGVPAVFAKPTVGTLPPHMQLSAQPPPAAAPPPGADAGRHVEAAAAHPAAAPAAPIAAAAPVEPVAPAAPVTPTPTAAPATAAAAAAPAAEVPSSSSTAAAVAAPTPAAAAPASEVPAVSGWGPLPGTSTSQPADSKPSTAEPAAAAAAPASDTPQQPPSYADRVRMSAQRTAAAAAAARPAATAAATAAPSAPKAAAPASAAGTPAASGPASTAGAAAAPPAASGSAFGPSPAAATAAAAADGPAPAGVASDTSYRPDLASSLDVAVEAPGVFLRGIHPETTQEDLKAVFGKFGTIVSITIIPSKTHDTNTAYVDYDSNEAVQAAMDAHGSDRGEGSVERLVQRLHVRGKGVMVLLKLPRTQRPTPSMSGRSDYRRGGPGTYGRSGFPDGGRARGGRGEMRQPNGGGRAGDMGGRMGGRGGRDGPARGDRGMRGTGGNGVGGRSADGRAPRSGEARAA